MILYRPRQRSLGEIILYYIMVLYCTIYYNILCRLHNVMILLRCVVYDWRRDINLCVRHIITRTCGILYCAVAIYVARRSFVAEWRFFYNITLNPVHLWCVLYISPVSSRLKSHFIFRVQLGNIIIHNYNLQRPIL